MDACESTTARSPLTAAGLFAGIGGIELGLRSAGIETVLVSEIEPGAAAVLEERFPDVELNRDVRTLRDVRGASIVAAGFPCQDLSQAGRTAGIAGRNSGLVGEVMRLIAPEEGPDWVVLENVPFMLSLARGAAMRFVAESLEELGYSWAYRVVDARSFGLPQRRRRVLLVASRVHDPGTVLFADEVDEPAFEGSPGRAVGFYWTEGARGLGWAADGVPTLKGGSTIGIPSPPAILLPDGRVVTPHVRDAERLQGFEEGWSEPGVANGTTRRRGEAHRWKLVGNAVSVPMSTWLAGRIVRPGVWDESRLLGDVARGRGFPGAACGGPGRRPREVAINAWADARPYRHLAEFLEHETAPLSIRAATGFLKRCRAGSLRFAPGFLGAIEEHLERSEAPIFAGSA